MTVHYRRGRPSRADELGAVAVSLLVGAGAAAAALYLTRLLLSKERLSDDGDRRRIPGSTGDAEG